jgi:hypothetical protein
VRQSHKLRVFENRVLKKIPGPERIKVTGDWRKLHNEDLYDMNCLDIIGLTNQEE